VLQGNPRMAWSGGWASESLRAILWLAFPLEVTPTDRGYVSCFEDPHTVAVTERGIFVIGRCMPLCGKFCCGVSRGSRRHPRQALIPNLAPALVGRSVPMRL
jgi:hypothetical protein